MSLKLVLIDLFSLHSYLHAKNIINRDMKSNSIL